ncbi:MAG: hypothetical protein IT324_26590 [Anaerolineae bacterium]|nr:hypothetical protein [Anaerolineae bacterium]
MFPPMTPMGERIRNEVERQELENRNAGHAAWSLPTISLPSFKWLRSPRKPEQQPRRVVLVK